MDPRAMVAEAWRRWLRAAGGGVFLGGVAGAGLLALAALLDGRSPGAAALLGGLLGLAGALVDTDWRGGPARAVEPASDPEGAWRALLALPEGHPLLGRLAGEAARWRPRFRASGDWRGAAILAVILALVLLWEGSRPGIPGVRRAGGGQTTAAGSGRAPAGPGNRAAGRSPAGPAAPGAGKEAPQPGPPGDNGATRVPAGTSEEAAAGRGPGELVPVPVESLPGRYVPGVDLRRLEPVVERFLRLRAQMEER